MFQNLPIFQNIARSPRDKNFQNFGISGFQWKLLKLWKLFKIQNIEWEELKGQKELQKRLN